MWPSRPTEKNIWGSEKGRKGGKKKEREIQRVGGGDRECTRIRM